MLDRVRYAPEVHERAFEAWRHHTAQMKAESTTADWNRVVGSIYESATPHEVIAPGVANKSDGGIPFPNSSPKDMPTVEGATAANPPRVVPPAPGEPNYDPNFRPDPRLDPNDARFDPNYRAGPQPSGRGILGVHPSGTATETVTRTV